MGQAFRIWAAFAALVALPASATSVSSEVSAGKGIFAFNLLGDIELRPDETYLTLSYGLSKAPLVESSTLEGVPPLNPAASHLLSVGADHALSRSWMLTGGASFGVPSVDRIVLNPNALPTSQVTLLSSRTSLGLSLGAAYDSAGLSNLEYGFDASVSATGHRLGRGVNLGGRLYGRQEQLGVLRPSAGAMLLVKDDTELSARGSYFLYSADPLTTGRFTEEELLRIEDGFLASAQRLGADLATTTRNMLFLEERMVQADAVGGFASAPVWVEARLSVAHRFSRLIKGQLSYTFDRYVPTQGHAHILSTKWTFRTGDHLRFWGALAVQRDEPLDRPAERAEGDPSPQTYGLATFGLEYSF
jgi:hypothetical protein